MRLPVLLIVLMAFVAPALAAPQVADSPLQLHTKKLANGLLVAVVENPSVPLATVEVGVHNGAMNEPLPLNGLSHLYEHMFFKGNAVIPDQGVYMEKLRQIGASWNGTTGTERVNYFYTVGSNELEPALKFMSDAIKTPRFDPAELTREKEVVLGEFDRNEANPDYYLSHAVTYALFYKYPTYKDPLGTRTSIKAATVDQMKWMQSVYYVPNNSILTVTGNVKADRVFALAEKYYGDWKAAPDPFAAHPLVKHPPLPASRVVLVAQPVEAATVRFDWQGPSTGDDMQNAVVADVFAYAVNQDGSRLQKALVDSGLAAHANLGYDTLKNTGEITLYLDTTPDKLMAATRAALAEASHFGDPDYVTAAQWESAQNLLAVHDLYERERMSEFAHTLTFWFAVADLQAYQNYIPSVRRTTRADGAAYARKYIVGKPMVLGAMASADDEKKNGITDASLQQVLDRDWKPLQGGGGGGPASSHDSGQVVAGFPDVESFSVNGIPVLLRRNTATPVVAAVTFFRGGSLNLTPANQGIERLALSVVTNGGAAGMTREERSRRLDAMGTDLSFDTSADFSRTDMKCIGEYFDASFDLYAQGIAHPSFDKADVELMRRQQLSSIQQQHADPDEEVRRLAELFFYRDHPYALRPIGTPEVVSKLQPADLAAYYGRLATRKRMLVVVVGNVDRAHVEQAITRNFAALAEGTAAPAPAPVPARPSALQTEARKLPTTYVRGMVPQVAPSDPRFAAAYLTGEILSNHLFEEVRTRRNLSYSVFAGASARLANYSVLYVTSAKPNEAVAVMKQTMQKLADTPLTEEEIRGHVATLVTHYFQGIETCQDQADRFGGAQIITGDWRQAYLFVENIRKVTPAQIQAEAKRLLDGTQWAVLGDVEHLDQKGFTGAPPK